MGKKQNKLREQKGKPSEKGATNGPNLPAVRTTSVVPYDSLSAYMREIRRYPKLSREEEKELALRYRNDHDLEAAYALISSNLWLVVKLARDYERTARNLLDLIQEGNIGLMEAVKNFDPYRGVRFPSYAVWWVKAYIIRYMLANLRIVKLGTTQAQRKLFFNLHKEKEKLERMGIAPRPKLLAEKLDVKESEVIEMEQRLGSPDVSVDAPLGGGDEEGSTSTLLGVLANESPSSEQLVEQKQRAEFIKRGFEEFAETLKDRERIILERRLLSEERATLQELSDELGVSRERIRQIENRMKEKLELFFSERLHDIDGDIGFS
jgi:RNA polymerase sigma-32 factor